VAKCLAPRTTAMLPSQQPQPACEGDFEAGDVPLDECKLALRLWLARLSAECDDLERRLVLQERDKAERMGAGGNSGGKPGKQKGRGNGEAGNKAGEIGGSSAVGPRKRLYGKSEFRGVFQSDKGKWAARVTVAGHKFNLGVFESEVAAARAYDAAAGVHFGPKAKFNFKQTAPDGLSPAEGQESRGPGLLHGENALLNADENVEGDGGRLERGQGSLEVGDNDSGGSGDESDGAGWSGEEQTSKRQRPNGPNDGFGDVHFEGEEQEPENSDWTDQDGGDDATGTENDDEDEQGDYEGEGMGDDEGEYNRGDDDDDRDLVNGASSEGEDESDREDCSGEDAESGGEGDGGACVVGEDRGTEDDAFGDDSRSDAW
jgi:hypothetical protein